MLGIDLSKYFTPKDIAVYILLVIIVIFALVKLNILGTRKGVKKSNKQRDKEKSEVNKRKRAIFFMKQFSNIYNLIGNSTPEYLFELKYLLERNDIQVKALDRRIKPEEVVGIFRFIQMLVVLITLLTVAFTLKAVMFVIALGVFLPKIYTLLLRGQIAAEDEQLEIETKGGNPNGWTFEWIGKDCNDYLMHVHYKGLYKTKGDKANDRSRI